MELLPEYFFNIIQNGENDQVEFKESKLEIPKEVYKSVCALSNRNGGHIFLGIKDSGQIVGINKNRIESLKKEFLSSVNNRNKISPPLLLTPIEYEIEDKLILYIRVPKSEEVIRCNNRIYDRNNDSDIDITENQREVFRLYSRKNGSYFVNQVYPAFKISDIRSDLFEKARRMTHSRTNNHPWLNMTDEEILRSSGLILRDRYSNIEGLTLAAILLFGTDQLIMSVLPQHKTDAIFRVFNKDRYDDRDVIITNLLDSYDRLIAFGQKHLNDTFHLEGIQSVSARDKILREIISNLLAHRDYSSGYVSKLVIEEDNIFTENANLAQAQGVLNLNSFEPISKNPPISKVFREIGLADELGSGMRNTFKYTQLYSNNIPEFKEGDIFRITIPLLPSATAKVGPKPNNETNHFSNETNLIKHDTNQNKFETNKLNNDTNLSFNEKINQIKLSDTEIDVLNLIFLNKALTTRNLNDQLDFSRSTIYRALKKLEEKS